MTLDNKLVLPLQLTKQPLLMQYTNIEAAMLVHVLNLYKQKYVYNIVIIILLFIPNINLGNSFTLGTAANFVLFTSNGAVSNTGSSTLTGKIGSDNGAISGFGTATVIGFFHNVDAVTALAKTDLLNAYNQLISVPATVSLHTPAFGSGETLTTGVYTISGAASLAGNLTLNGLGDTNAIFIFRFGGAYSVGASSSVILTSGARPCNIFWISEGAISIAANTIMKGTLIANNAAVSMAAGGNLEGRMLSTTGAVAFGPCTAYMPNCFSNISNPSSTPYYNPNLGSTINFVLFTSNGAVTNSGVSSLGLNIGSDVGLISGFGSATVTGSIFNADNITAQAKTDLTDLYNQLSSTTTTNASHIPSLGYGETLNSGVYYIGSAGSLGGKITLDAQGDTNALFIFKINGAFTAEASSEINLINLASSCSVFWIAEGAISIGASSIMKGTFIANNAAVSMAASGDLRGRLFSTSGAIAFDASVATNADNCKTSSNPLPIELLSFKSECYNQNIILNWSTATESNNDYFSIERSNDGIKWKIVTKVDGAGHSTSLEDYSFIDFEPYNSISYFRLKQTDFNGKYKYSAKIAQNTCSEKGSEITIYPNPVNEILNISFEGDKSQIISISIYNVLKEIVYYSTLYQSKIVFENKLNGIYFLHVNYASKNINKKFVAAD